MILRYIEVWDGDEYEPVDDVVTVIQLIKHWPEADRPDELGLRIWYLVDA